MRNRPLSYTYRVYLITIIPILSILFSASHQGGVDHGYGGSSSAHPDHQRSPEFLAPEFCAPYTSSLPHAAAMRLRDLIQSRQVQSRIIRDLEDLIKHKGDAIFVSRPMKQVVARYSFIYPGSIWGHTFTGAGAKSVHYCTHYGVGALHLWNLYLYFYPQYGRDGVQFLSPSVCLSVCPSAAFVTKWTEK